MALGRKIYCYLERELWGIKHALYSKRNYFLGFPLEGGRRGIGLGAVFLLDEKKVVSRFQDFSKRRNKAKKIETKLLFIFFLRDGGFLFVSGCVSDVRHPTWHRVLIK